MTTSMQMIPFHGDALTYVERDGVAYVALKPICERLGLNWKSQHAKISADPEDWGIQIIAIPSAGGEQETACLPVNRIAAWLFSIHPNRVSEELRDALRRYRAEAADVLDRHFRLKLEEQSTEIADLRSRLWHCHRHLLAALPKWGRIKLLAEAGVSYPFRAKRANLSQTMLIEEEEAMRHCGLSAVWDRTAPKSSLDRIADLEFELRLARAKAAGGEITAAFMAADARTSLEKIMDGDADA